MTVSEISRLAHLIRSAMVQLKGSSNRFLTSSANPRVQSIGALTISMQEPVWHFAPISDYELEFVKQPRLPHPGLSHCRNHLTVAGAGQCRGMLERLDFALTSDKLGKTPNRCMLQPRPQWSEPDDLVDLDWLAQTLNSRSPFYFLRKRGKGSPEGAILP
jgi:hypothetical protein